MNSGISCNIPAIFRSSILSHISNKLMTFTRAFPHFPSTEHETSKALQGLNFRSDNFAFTLASAVARFRSLISKITTNSGITFNMPHTFRSSILAGVFDNTHDFRAHVHTFSIHAERNPQSVARLEFPAQQVLPSPLASVVARFGSSISKITTNSGITFNIAHIFRSSILPGVSDKLMTFALALEYLSSTN
jgi:hypothetical protein